MGTGRDSRGRDAAGTEAERPLRVYRPHPGWLVLAFLMVSVMLMITIGMMVAPGQGGVSLRVTGAIGTALMGFVTWDLLRGRVEVTREAIVRYGELRRKVVPWAQVQALEVARRDTVTPWYVVEIVTAGGRRVRLTALAGLKGHAERLAADLRSLQPK